MKLGLTKRFPEKRVFITGAGSGLGRALAREFAEDGWTIGIGEMRPDALAEAAEEMAEMATARRSVRKKLLRMACISDVVLFCDCWAESKREDVEGRMTVVRRKSSFFAGAAGRFDVPAVFFRVSDLPGGG